MVEKEVMNIMVDTGDNRKRMEEIAACRKCGHMGHLTTQCMNVLKTKDGQVRQLLTAPQDEEELDRI